MKLTVTILSLILICCTCIVSCGKVGLSTDKAKYSFAIGHQIGENMKRQDIELELDAFKAGVAEGIAGIDKSMNPKDRVQALKIMTEIQRKKLEEKNKTAE